MDFLGIGPLELIFIVLIAIVVVGPKDIGKTARTVGRFLNKVLKSEEWRTLTEASKTLRTLPNRLAREAQLEELQEVQATLKDATQEFRDAGKTIQGAGVDFLKNAQDAQATLKDDVKEAKKSTSESDSTAPDNSPDPAAIEEGMQAWVAPDKSSETPPDSPEASDKKEDSTPSTE
jgi:sec-independent protein translocase protein TatB